MINSNPAVGSLGNVELLAATREILRRSCVVEADLLVHLAEIEERRLHSEMAFPTMFAFCVDELGFSEDQAYNRTTVARAARRFPAMLDSLRSGAVHLTGLLGRYLRRSGATSTAATADAALSSTHVATDARRQASSSSITWTGSPARTCTIRNESS